MRSAVLRIFHSKLQLCSIWQGFFLLLTTGDAAQSREREVNVLHDDLVFHFFEGDNIPRTQLSKYCPAYHQGFWLMCCILSSAAKPMWSGWVKVMIIEFLVTLSQYWKCLPLYYLNSLFIFFHFCCAHQSVRHIITPLSPSWADSSHFQLTPVQGEAPVRVWYTALLSIPSPGAIWHGMARVWGLKAQAQTPYFNITR